MNRHLRLALVGALSLALLSACGTRSVRVEPPADEGSKAQPDQPAYRYVENSAFNTASVEALRAAAAPEVPLLIEGKSEAGDERALAAQSFLRIGTATFASDDVRAREDAIELGQKLRADQVSLYHTVSESPDAASGSHLVAAYYVRLKLLFGASFRNINASERDNLKLDGGVVIGSVLGETPASAANLLSGDIIVAVDGAAVTDRKQFQDLLRARAGKTANLRVLRDGRALKRVVQLGALPPRVAE